MRYPKPGRNDLGLGQRIKVFVVGEVKKLFAKRNKFGE
jgi:hypothetical protein